MYGLACLRIAIKTTKMDPRDIHWERKRKGGKRKGRQKWWANGSEEMMRKKEAKKGGNCIIIIRTTCFPFAFVCDVDCWLYLFSLSPSPHFVVCILERGRKTDLSGPVCIHNQVSTQQASWGKQEGLLGKLEVAVNPICLACSANVNMRLI